MSDTQSAVAEDLKDAQAEAATKIDDARKKATKKTATAKKPAPEEKAVKSPDPNLLGKADAGVVATLNNLRQARFQYVNQLGETFLRMLQMKEGIERLEQQSQTMIDSESERLGIDPSIQFSINPETCEVFRAGPSVIQPPQLVKSEGSETPPEE